MEKEDRLQLMDDEDGVSAFWLPWLLLAAPLLFLDAWTPFPVNAKNWLVCFANVLL